MKFLFHKDHLFATLLVFAFIGLIDLVFHLKMGFLNPVKKSLEDFSAKDIYLAKLQSQKTNQDIIIVDFHNLPSNENHNLMAVTLQKIAESNPKVIGIDIKFKFLPGDEVLPIVMNQYKDKIVLGCKLEEYEAHEHIYLEKSQSWFAEDTKDFTQGYANFYENFGKVRNIAKEATYKNPKTSSTETVYPFAYEIARKANPAMAEKWLKKDKLVNINYKRELFSIVDGTDLMDENFPTQLFKDKIVLVGDLSPYDERYDTPVDMNSEVYSANMPMAGVEIHANVVSMIKNGTYLKKAPWILSFLLSFVICYLHMVLFNYWFLHKHKWFHLYSKIFQLGSSVAVVFIVLWLLHSVGFYCNMTLILAPIFLAVDMLYFWEGIAKWLNQKFKYQTIYDHEHHA